MKIYSYKKHKYRLEHTLNGFYTVKPMNFTWGAIITNYGKKDTISDFKKYIDRVLHYNQEE